MAGKAVTRKNGVSKKGGVRSKPVAKQTRAGIVWGVGRTASTLKKGRYSERIGIGAPIFLAGVMQYLTSEILEIAGDIAFENKKSIIKPKHIMQAIRNDEELMLVFSHIHISEGGNKQHIESALFPNKKGKKVASE